MYLNCHSYYSLRYGTISVEDLVETAKAANVKTLALTDINSTTAIFEFVKLCHQAEIHPVVGIEFRQNNELLYIALAKNTDGFEEMNLWLSNSNLEHKPLRPTAPVSDDVFIVYPFESAPSQLRENEYIGVRIRQLNQLCTSPLRKNKDKLVVLHPVVVKNRDSFRLHKLLRAIDKNTLVTKLQEHDLCSIEDRMLPIDELRQHYKEMAHLLKNTEQLLDTCRFYFDFNSSKNKRTYTNSRYSDLDLLRSLGEEGLKIRYGKTGKNRKQAEDRMRKELEIIHNMGFSAYFLITWDIIRYSQSRSFYHVGRGSGANSIVSYALGITNVCPLELDLYFERFLNPNRRTPPDFDIDWSWKDRDDILNYIFNRFDKNHTAFVGTITHFKHRSIMRELGKTLGLPKEELDELSFQRKDNHPKGKLIRAIHRFGKMLEFFPNMRSVHACGILISEKPITCYTALDMPPKGFQTCQFDMYTGEDIGFEKLDILGQRGIGHINTCVEMVEENRNIKVDIHHELDKIKYDKAANELLREGQTLGCFYVESPAMRQLLRKLKCDNYNQLVAATSIIRPGVAKSGMMAEYIRRHNRFRPFEYLHPLFEEHLQETYGIMVYQEDVIKIAHYFAGLTLGEADILRRAMSGKTRSRKELDKIKDSFFRNCQQRGYSPELTEEVYRQIASFAGYSFCKAHSASYTVESYQSLYLKAHYPLEFMVAVLNNFGGFYRAEIYFLEAKRLGAELCPPCVNQSNYLSTLGQKNNQQIFVGFNYIKNLERQVAGRIEIERHKRGPYTSLNDFIRRIPIGLESLETLIFLNAFRFTGKPKKELALEARMLLNQSAPTVPSLFNESPPNFDLPPLDESPFEAAFDELELLDFMVSHSMFDLLETEYRGNLKAVDMINFVGKKIEIVGYYIARKDVRTKKGLMHFGCWIDESGEVFDTCHFPDSLRKSPLKGRGCYLLFGHVVLDFGSPSIQVSKCEKLPLIPDPRYE